MSRRHRTGSSADPVTLAARSSLMDHRFDRLRNRTNRRRLVIAATALLLVLPVAWLVGGEIPGMLALLATVGVGWMLRTSVRTVADLPEEYLDERQSGARNRAYLQAYTWLGGLVLVPLAIAVLAFILGSDGDRWAVTWSAGQVFAVYWTVTAAALLFPSMALALSEPDELPG